MSGGPVDLESPEGRKVAEFCRAGLPWPARDLEPELSLVWAGRPFPAAVPVYRASLRSMGGHIPHGDGTVALHEDRPGFREVEYDTEVVEYPMEPPKSSLEAAVLQVIGPERNVHQIHRGKEILFREGGNRTPLSRVVTAGSRPHEAALLPAMILEGSLYARILLLREDVKSEFPWLQRESAIHDPDTGRVMAAVGLCLVELDWRAGQVGLDFLARDTRRIL